jgi:hypothetical protein
LESAGGAELTSGCLKIVNFYCCIGVPNRIYRLGNAR